MKINPKAFRKLLITEQITRGELAEKLDIDRSYLWRILKGDNAGIKVLAGFRRAFPDKNIKDYFDIMAFEQDDVDNLDE